MEYLTPDGRLRKELLASKSASIWTLPASENDNPLGLPEDTLWSPEKLHLAKQIATNLGLTVINHAEIIGDNRVTMTTIYIPEDPQGNKMGDYMARINPPTSGI